MDEPDDSLLAVDDDGTHALQRAAEAGDVKAVEQLLARGYPVDYAPEDNADGRALLVAVRARQPAIVERLLAAGASIEHVPGWDTLLHDAARVPQPDVTRALIAAGVSPATAQRHGELPIHHVGAYLETWTEEDTRWACEVASLLLEHGSPIDAVGEFGEPSPLSGAILRGAPLPLVEFLLAKGADPNLVPPRRRDAPLWAALKGGRRDALRALEEAGGRLKDAFVEPEDAQVAIGWILQSEVPEPDKLALLDALERAGVDAGGEFSGAVGMGMPGGVLHPLVEAVRAGALAAAARLARASRDRAFGDAFAELAHVPASPEALRLARLLLPEGATLRAFYEPMNAGRRDLVDLLLETEQAKRADTLWGVIAFTNDDAWVELLLARGADARGRDEDRGATPLHAAASGGRAAVVARLLEAGADLDALDHQGMTPLMVAAESGHLELVKQLAARGAGLSRKDELGETLLHRFAAAGGDAKLVKLAIEQGLDPAAANALGETPLHLVMAAKAVDEKGLALLLAAKADVDARDASGATPLHRAAARARGAKPVAALLARKAQVHAADPLGRTPLHLAAAGGDPAIVKALLDGGADAGALDAFGLSPRDVARITRSKGGASIAAERARAPRVLRRHEALGEPLLKALKAKWQKRLLDVLPLVRLRVPLVPTGDARARSRLFARSAPLPAGWAWPVVATEQRPPLAAIAVIDLAELHPFDLEGIFPDRGSLALFAGYDADFSAHATAAGVARAALVPAGAPVAARPAEADALYKSHPDEVRVGFGAPFLDLPDPQGSPLLGDDDDGSEYEELRARVRAIDVAKLLQRELPSLRAEEDSVIVASLLGHTAPIQESTQPLASLMDARELPYRARDDAAARALAAASWRALASIGVHDGGFDHDHVWLIDQRDLEGRAIERATYVFDNE